MMKLMRFTWCQVQKLVYDLQSRLDEVIQIEKLEEIKRILGDFTYHVESKTDRETNYIEASGVLDYIDEMWQVFSIDSKKNREELL